MSAQQAGRETDEFFLCFLWVPHLFIFFTVNILPVLCVLFGAYRIISLNT